MSFVSDEFFRLDDYKKLELCFRKGTLSANLGAEDKILHLKCNVKYKTLHNSATTLKTVSRVKVVADWCLFLTDKSFTTATVFLVSAIHNITNLIMV